MHPFGGIPICPRCSTQVYAAEQVMGPGRKLYHKPCLACTLCNKRLDSRTLLEHDQLPYCKTCHIKNFGTRDLRHANLPHREDVPLSPIKTTQLPLPSPPGLASPTRADPPPPLLKPTRSLAANSTGLRSPTFSRNGNGPGKTFDKDDGGTSFASGSASPPTERRPLSPSRNTTLDTGTGQENVPHIAPLQRSHTGDNSAISTRQAPTPRPTHHSHRSVGSFAPATGLVPTPTGTRYGALLNRSATTFAGVNLTGNSPASPKRWGGDTPLCPKCSQNVYFAEQVKAVGKAYHKGCLRCSECNTLLDSSRLRDHDGDPYCVRCYGKSHGPQGSGYALLGKAGG